jgi:hypothetical protein
MSSPPPLADYHSGRATGDSNWTGSTAGDSNSSLKSNSPTPQPAPGRQMSAPLDLVARMRKSMR